LHIATIRSRIVENSRSLEIGYFSTEVEVDMKQAATSGDPQGYVQHKVAEAFAMAIATTGIPKGERMWTIEFGRFAQNNFNYPEGIVV
jgi:hypothetical protein